MDNELKLLLNRADEAIAESKRLHEQNRASTTETRWWLQRLYWLLDQTRQAKRRFY